MSDATAADPIERLAWLDAVSRHGFRGQLVVLRTAIALAQFASSGKGTCWPSAATLAERAGVRVDHLRVALRDLEQAGFISRPPIDERRRMGVGKVPTITLTTPEREPFRRAPFNGATSERSPDDWAKGSPSAGQKGALPQGSKPSLEPSLEPGGERATPPRDLWDDPPEPEQPPDPILSQAPATLPVRLRDAWAEIARDRGPEIANRALAAARRLHGLPSEQQLAATLSCAVETDSLTLPAERWPNWLKVRDERQAKIDAKRNGHREEPQRNRPTVLVPDESQPGGYRRELA